MFDDALSFSEGLAAAKDSSTGLWGYIDKTGAWVVKPQFELAESFSGGLAQAWSEGSSATFGYIDKTGAWIVRPQ